MDDVSADSGHSSHTSQPGLSITNDDSTVSSQPSITNDANVSFTQPITEDSVHSRATLADKHSIIGSNISFGFIESPNMPTHANVGQALAAPRYKEEVNSNLIIAELTQYKWELVTRNQVKQHISSNVKEIITNAQLRSGNCILLSGTILPWI